MRLGEIVTTLKLVPVRQMLLALSYQFDMPYIEPDVHVLDRKLLGRMSIPFLRRSVAVPVFTDGEAVMIITPDPLRKDLVKEFTEMLRRPVQLAIGPKAEILQALEDFERMHRGASGTERGAARPDGEAVDPTEENVIGIVDYLIAKAVRQGASDIHIEPLANRVRIRYRIDGVLVHRTDLPLSLAPKISSRIKVLANSDIVEKRKHQGGRIYVEVDGGRVDLRVSIYVTVHGENVVIRVLNAETGILPMEKLGMLPRMLTAYKETVLDAPTGIVLITGPTGSGKTTTLYSSVTYCNDMGVKIITAEDPVEYILEGIVQCSIDVKAGRDFNQTLREIVRQDPDVIVLGEIRDRETAAIAIQAALTGHKVFATFHTEDAIGGLLRLIDMDIETFLISSTVVCVIAQRLVRRICSNCKTAVDPTPYELRVLGLTNEPIDDFKIYRGAGCASCHDTGYKGRVGIYEMLVLNDDLRGAILAKKPAHEIREGACAGSGLFSMQEDGIAKVLLGLTTFEEIIKHVPRSVNQRSLRDLLAFSTTE
jgi:type IV pilus assembly protein PilB